MWIVLPYGGSPISQKGLEVTIREKKGGNSDMGKRGKEKISRKGGGCWIIAAGMRQGKGGGGLTAPTGEKTVSILVFGIISRGEKIFWSDPRCI